MVLLVLILLRLLFSPHPLCLLVRYEYSLHFGSYPIPQYILYPSSMGSSLSHQEELFARWKWSELLEHAMQADAHDTESVTSTDTPSLAESSSPSNRGDGAPASTAKKKTGGKGTEFRLSFQEWQSFLAVLELHKTEKTGGNCSSAPSDICARLELPQIRVPVVALMVHWSVWWCGGISSTELSERLQELVALIAEGQESGIASSSSPGSTSSAETSYTKKTSDSDLPEKATRKARLMRFMKDKVQDRLHRKHHHKTGTSRGPNDDDAMLDMFYDFLQLTEDLLRPEELAVLGEGDLEQLAAHSIPRQSRTLYRIYHDKIMQPSIKDRPVIAAVTVLLLAIYTCATTIDTPSAVEGVTHLQRLKWVMESLNPSSRFEKPNQVATSEVAAAGTDGPPQQIKSIQQLPLIAALEAALIHRQHEEDVQQCLAAPGVEMWNRLQTIRQQRRQLQSRPLKDLTQQQRWDISASQYIGQRTAWQTLRSHFLSVGVFDVDKPTVVVLFGPSGYGKSELAKRVASILHGCPIAELEPSGKMVYIHMPSFCTKDSIYSLVDPPAAHVGSGILLSALQQQSDAVVVLDEFEKSTAEAINNLWLSAFQKNGVLRSLKEASRSVSTIRTTFILTCNIAADAITAHETAYLSASPADQEVLRRTFQSQCKDTCRNLMGDPFVNRVDYFLPLMPYTRDERRQFVCTLLERLLSAQAAKNRILYPTPRFVEAMVSQLDSFHAATLEEVVRQQISQMVNERWTSAVLSVEQTIGTTQPVVLPAYTAEIKMEQPQRGSQDVWDTLPGGSECLAKWAAQRNSDEASGVPSLSPAATDGSGATPAVETAIVSTTKHGEPSTTFASDTLAMEKLLDLDTDKKRILYLEKELQCTQDRLKLKEKEVQTLKETLLLLEKLLAVVLIALLTCFFAMSLLIGAKMTLIFAGMMTAVVFLVLKAPLSLLVKAVAALFHFLGWTKSCFLLLFIALWIGKVSRIEWICK